MFGDASVYVFRMQHETQQLQQLQVKSLYVSARAFA